MTDTVRKQQCQTAQKAFASVYDHTGGEQYHVITLQEINVALADRGLPPFTDKHELEEAMLSELVAASPSTFSESAIFASKFPLTQPRPAAGLFLSHQLIRSPSCTEQES
jgi:hypothetical protein